MITARESDPTFHCSRNAAAATGAAACPDAESPLVMAPADGWPVWVDRPGRVGRLRRRPGGDAQLDGAGSACRTRRQRSGTLLNLERRTSRPLRPSRCRVRSRFVVQPQAW